MTPLTFAPWPEFSVEERQAVDSVLSSGKVNYWTGDQGRNFEKEFAEHLDVRHAVALMNGTVALEVPLRLWGLNRGDEVIVTPRSFIASTSAAVLQGCTPVFADVDRDSGNISVDSIERALSPRTKAIIVVHLAGWPCDMGAIMDLARNRGIRVLEDCAQAHGSKYRGRPVGSFGDAAAYSFCQDKIITTGGEGGLLATSDSDLWNRAWAFKDHGKSFDLVFNKKHPAGFRWLHDSFGSNLRLTEMQAAIGRIQLRKLEDWVEKRRANAHALAEGLRETPGLRIPEPPEHVRHAYYRFYVYLELEKLRSGWNRDRVVELVNERGVPCFSGSCSEIYREGAFEGSGFRPPASLKVAQELGESSIAFLVHPTLGPHHMNIASSELRSVLKQAIR